MPINFRENINPSNTLPSIVIIQGPFLPVPPIKGGAVEKLWYALGQKLNQAGHSVTQISRGHPSLPIKSIENGVQHIRISSLDRPNSRALAMIFDFWYSAVAVYTMPKADIVVTNSFFAPIFVRFLARSKIYISIHRLPRGQYWLYHGASRFQCVSSSVKEELIRQHPWARDITRVIPNFVPAARMDVENNPLSKVGVHRRSLLFVGRIHPEKGVGLLISAYCRLPENIQMKWDLNILGPFDRPGGGGGDEYINSLREASRLSVGRIEFHDAIYDEIELGNTYRNADLFVYPSIAKHGEAFGLAPLEAMSYGVPAVVSNLDCFLDFIEPGVNGWSFDAFAVDPVDRLATVIGQAIGCINADSSRYNAAAQATAQRFSLDKVSQLLSTDFVNLMNT